MPIPGLSDWLQTPLGQYVLAWEQEKYDQAVADVFGYFAIQIGLRDADLLRTNRITHRFRCDDGPRDERVAITAQLDALPFASSNVDLVVLPHVLEFADHPHQVLREVERILVPEGQVVITGFNPFSQFGLRRRLASYDAEFPWNGQYLSVPRLKDWLNLLSFEVQLGAFGCYGPAVNRKNWLHHGRWLDPAGDRWWPIFGGTYLLQAVKRVHGMRLIRPDWKEKTAAGKVLAPLIGREGLRASGRAGGESLSQPTQHTVKQDV